MNNKGFTLLEFMLSISLIAFIAGISVPIYQAFQTRNDSDIAQVTWVHTLRRAQVQSQSIVDDTTWGARVESGSIVLFSGSSYATRDSGSEEIFDIPISITVSGLQEVVFSKLYGYPDVAGTTTLTSSINELETITINEKGTITY